MFYILTRIPSLLINADIDEIIHRGEERTQEINQKYAALNIDDLNNFKSDFSVKEWEGEEFGGKVRFTAFVSKRTCLKLTIVYRKILWALDGCSLLSANARVTTPLMGITRKLCVSGLRRRSNRSNRGLRNKL